MAISTCVAHAFRVFTDLEHVTNERERPCASIDLNSAFAEELGRFRIWSGNIGAHKTGRSSLDYRLRENLNLERMVIKLLDDLKRTLEDALSIASGIKTPWDDISDSDDDVLDTEDDEGVSMTEVEANATSGSIAESEIQQLREDVAEIITCLFRFSMTIRNPVSHAKFARAEKVNKSAFEPFDIGHVRNKFPDSDETLILRLGKAITKRRRYLTYLEDHHQKLESGLVDTIRSRPGETDGEDAQTQVQPLSTVASSLPAAFQNNLTIEAEFDRGSEAGYSETSYASSVDEGTRLCPPPLPAEAMSEQPYQCPLCYMIIDIHTTVAWRRHVFKDLHPYVCTFSDCTTADRLFDSRTEWFNHELQLHRRLWQCLQGCSQTFTDKEQFETHLRGSHAHTFDEVDLPSFMEISEFQTSMEDVGTCPLCKEQVPSLKQLRRHLGRHQEQLSLFALPLSVKEGDNNGKHSDESDSGSNDTIAVPEVGSVTETQTDEDKDIGITNDTEENENNNDPVLAEQSNNPFALLTPSEAATYGRQTSWPEVEDPGFWTANVSNPVNPFQLGEPSIQKSDDTGIPSEENQAKVKNNPPSTFIFGGSGSPEPYHFELATDTVLWDDTPFDQAIDQTATSSMSDQNKNNPFFTMQDNNPFKHSNPRLTPASDSSPRRDGGIRKKNARFEIPAERSLINIDELISLAQDDEEIKELKQQKRLLRNRQAALDSRIRKKKHVEELEDESKRVKELEEEIRRLRKIIEERDKIEHNVEGNE